MNRSKTLVLALIALLSTAPIMSRPTSRYQDLVTAQKSRELTSDEKAELQILDARRLKILSDSSHLMKDMHTIIEFNVTNDQLSIEFGTLVLSGLIREKDAANAQTGGVNYERLAQSLEQLHIFNECQALINKLSHLDEID